MALHGAALRASRVPTQYWESLSRKLLGEVGERSWGGSARESGPEGAAPEGSPEPQPGPAGLRGQRRDGGEPRPWDLAVGPPCRAQPLQPWVKRRVTVLLSRGQWERHSSGCVTETAARGWKIRQVYCAYLISSFCCRREVWMRLEVLVARGTVLEVMKQKTPQRSTTY